MRKGFFAGWILALLCPGCTGGPAPRPGPASRLPVPAIERPQQETSAWWFRAGAMAAHDNDAGREQARNLILFVGDGMSLTTVAAARIFEGQARGEPGEENRLSFEQFPYTALSKTYNTDSQTPDSAGTMTALVTGVKTRLGMLSVGQRVRAAIARRALGKGWSLRWNWPRPPASPPAS